jgi:hypothetical protein
MWWGSKRFPELQLAAMDFRCLSRENPGWVVFATCGNGFNFLKTRGKQVPKEIEEPELACQDRRG